MKEYIIGKIYDEEQIEYLFAFSSDIEYECILLRGDIFEVNDEQYIYNQKCIRHNGQIILFVNEVNTPFTYSMNKNFEKITR